MFDNNRVCIVDDDSGFTYDFDRFHVLGSVFIEISTEKQETRKEETEIFLDTSNQINFYWNIILLKCLNWRSWIKKEGNYHFFIKETQGGKNLTELKLSSFEKFSNDFFKVFSDRRTYDGRNSKLNKKSWLSKLESSRLLKNNEKLKTCSWDFFNMNLLLKIKILANPHHFFISVERSAQTTIDLRNRLVFVIFSIQLNWVTKTLIWVTLFALNLRRYSFI